MGPSEKREEMEFPIEGDKKGWADVEDNRGALPYIHWSLQILAQFIGSR